MCEYLLLHTLYHTAELRKVMRRSASSVSPFKCFWTSFWENINYLTFKWQKHITKSIKSDLQIGFPCFSHELSNFTEKEWNIYSFSHSVPVKSLIVQLHEQMQDVVCTIQCVSYENVKCLQLNTDQVYATNMALLSIHARLNVSRNFVLNRGCFDFNACLIIAS